MGGGEEVTPAETSVATLLLWFAGLGSVLSVLTVLWTIFSGPAKKNATVIDALKVDLAQPNAAHARLRDRVDSLPNADMMHRLELSLARMEGHIDRLDERLKPVAAISERMQELLIEQGRK